MLNSYCFIPIYTITVLLLLACSAESHTRVPVDNEGQSAVVDSVWYSLDEAQELAQENNKKILINIYTDWCGFCRRMDREVYSDDEIIAALGEYYYPVRLDAESSQKVTYNGQTMTKAELALAFGATSYPTAVFIDESGNAFGAQPGFIEKRVFKNILEFVGTNAYLNQSFDSFQRSGR